MLVLGIAFLMAALLVFSAAFGLIALPNRSVRRRLSAMTVQSEKSSRKLVTSADAELGFAGRFTPLAMLSRIERNMVLAGRPEGWSRRSVVVAKPLGAVGGLIFALVIFANTDSSLMKLIGLGAIILGYFVPDLLIYNQATKRQEQIQKELPDTLDQIVISIEAGTGFEAALAQAAENGSGPLAEEFIRLGQDVSLGMTRRDAYLALADRTSVKELRDFAKSIVQAEEFGVSIASVVRVQAKEMRIGRRARAEAKAQQVPVKILIPLMLCILPVLFVFVLGPAVVSAYAQN